MKIFLPVILVAATFLSAVPVRAGDCFSDPVFRYSGSGTIKSTVFLRNDACMDGSSVLGTIPTGASVNVLGATDGWYAVEWNGGRGWVGEQFVDSHAGETGISLSYAAYGGSYPSVAPSSPPSTPSSPVTSDPTVLGRVNGFILLQVESHGEAWYVDPVSKKRYYMKDGPTAYQMMRSFGLGVTEADYEAMAAGNVTMKNRLRGRIVLRVQAHGEAYYIHPKDLKLHYLQNGDEAYRVMRLYSLGITNADLDQLASATIPLK